MPADYKQFTDALRGAQGIATPQSSIPEIANAMASQFRAGAVDLAGQASNVTANQNAEDEERLRKEAQARRQQELADKLDPSKYVKQRKEDGGFDFFDPSGNRIDVNRYAKLTGQTRAEVLADSDNPVDQQFLYDYNEMKRVNQAIWSNDTAEMEDIRSRYGDISKKTPQSLNLELIKKYPHLWGKGSYQESYGNIGNPIFKTGGGTNGKLF